MRHSRISAIRRAFALSAAAVSLFSNAPFVCATPAADDAKSPAIAEKVAAMRKIDGFVPLYWDEGAGRMYLEVGRLDSELLYQVSLATGVGSNPIGLDRGQLGPSRIVVFERVGPRVLLVERNTRYRATSENAPERRAVRDSFAESILWGFDVAAQDGDRVLVDATAFFLRDAHGVAARLRDAQQGSYRVDAARSALYMPSTKAFPKNTEVEATLTFVTEGPAGSLVSSVAPSPDAVTVREHHSFVELPGPGFRPRALDPRVGSLYVEFYDYGAPITESLEQRYVVRHRLEKRDPAAAVSEPVEPIVYYVDSGTPEPIRSALIEGASWWNQAFEAAGFKNAFQVRPLPDGADPMDIRYNVISWVHRSTRGWSYGGSVVDPRTGEIIKGNVTLGSLRVRQDYIIGSGLVPPHAGTCDLDGGPDPSALVEDGSSDAALRMSLARIRQLAAHEVGHSIGLAHNFAASTYGRASVMDYPAPLVEIRDGKLDLANAYAVGIGDYDKFAISYAYSQFPAGTDERAALRRLVDEGEARGLLFLSDDDARPAGAANPLASLWDNGADAVAMLRHEMDVRRTAIRNFGLGVLADGEPLSMLEPRFLPLYLHHRYQLAAAVKTLGGVRYTFAVREGSGASPQPVQSIIAPATQRDALRAVLETVDARELTVPERIVDLMPPPAYGFDNARNENFPERTSPVFDPVGAATVAADLAVKALLEPNRAARLVGFHARDEANPSFGEVVDALVVATWTPRDDLSGAQRAVWRGVGQLVVRRLVELAERPDAEPFVRATASSALRSLAAKIKAVPWRGDDAVHARAALDEIERFLARPGAPAQPIEPLEAPPGDPIGMP